MMTRLPDETRRLLGHHLTFGAPFTRVVDGHPPMAVTTHRVTCGYCAETWPGVGFVIAKCAAVPVDTEETQ